MFNFYIRSAATPYSKTLAVIKNIMKKVLTLIFVSFLFFNVHAGIDLKIQLISETDSTIDISITATNTSEKDTILFYKFESKSICMGILNIDFIEANNGKIYEYSPCAWVTDIDRIILGDKNSVVLKPRESYKHVFNMNLNQVSPYIKKGKYFLEANIIYEYGNFESELPYEIFRGSSISDRIEINE